MTKYKFKKQSTSLSDKDINRHKNFNKVLGGYNQLYQYKKATRPLYRNRKLLGIIILIMILLLTLVLVERDEKTSIRKKSDAKESLP